MASAKFRLEWPVYGNGINVYGTNDGLKTALNYDIAQNNPDYYVGMGMLLNKLLRNTGGQGKNKTIFLSSLT
jgi:hypothetical protein